MDAPRSPLERRAGSLARCASRRRAPTPSRSRRSEAEEEPMGRRFALVLLVVLGACGFNEIKKPPLASERQRRLYTDAWAAAARWGVTNPLDSRGARRACAWL